MPLPVPVVWQCKLPCAWCKASTSLAGPGGAAYGPTLLGVAALLHLPFTALPSKQANLAWHAPHPSKPQAALKHPTGRIWDTSEYAPHLRTRQGTHVQDMSGKPKTHLPPEPPAARRWQRFSSPRCARLLRRAPRRPPPTRHPLPHQRQPSRCPMRLALARGAAASAGCRRRTRWPLPEHTFPRRRR